MKSTSTMAFFTTIPISIMAPIAAMRLRLIPDRNSAMATPEKANGIESMMISGILSDSNWDAITR